MILRRKTIKSLITMSATPEEADKIIMHQYKVETVKGKIAFLKGMFDIEEVGHNHKDEATYYVMLDTIQKSGTILN